MSDLNGKTAIVTGGGQGLGESICKKFAENGVSVTVGDIRRVNAERVAAELKSLYGTPSLAVQTDVTSEKDVEHMVKKTVGEYERLDIMVSNAGIVIAHEISEFPLNDFKKVVDVNLFGFFFCAQSTRPG